MWVTYHNWEKQDENNFILPETPEKDENDGKDLQSCSTKLLSKNIFFSIIKNLRQKLFRTSTTGLSSRSKKLNLKNIAKKESLRKKNEDF